MKNSKNIILFISVSLFITFFSYVLWTTELQKTPTQESFEIKDIKFDQGEKGLLITSVGGKEVNISITKKPVENAQIQKGILTFYEFEKGQWNFKAINIEKALKKNNKHLLKNK